MLQSESNPWGWGPERQLRLIGQDASVQFDEQGVTYQPDMPEMRVHFSWAQVQEMYVEVPVMSRGAWRAIEIVSMFGPSVVIKRRAYFSMKVYEGWKVHEWTLARPSTVIFSRRSSAATEALLALLSEFRALHLLGHRADGPNLVQAVHAVQSKFGAGPLAEVRTRRLVRAAVAAAQSSESSMAEAEGTVG